MSIPFGEPRWTGFGESSCCKFVGRYGDHDVWCCQHLRMPIWIVTSEPSGIGDYYTYDTPTLSQWREQKDRGKKIDDRADAALYYLLGGPNTDPASTSTPLDGNDEASAFARVIIRRTMMSRFGIAEPSNAVLLQFWMNQPGKCGSIIEECLFAARDVITLNNVQSEDALKLKHRKQWRDLKAIALLMSLIDVQFQPMDNLRDLHFVYDGKEYRYLATLFTVVTAKLIRAGLETV